MLIHNKIVSICCLHWVVFYHEVYAQHPLPFRHLSIGNELFSLYSETGPMFIMKATKTVVEYSSLDWTSLTTKTVIILLHQLVQTDIVCAMKKYYKTEENIL